MAASCRQILGLVLAIIGFLGTIIICALPLWKVSVIGTTIATSQIIFEGLWMKCVMQSTGQMQCKPYDSTLTLLQDLQTARKLIVIAIIVEFFGILLGVVGGKCTNFMPDERQKTKVAIASGVLFIIAATLVVLPVSWTANTITADMFSPDLTSNQRMDLGAALYMGWASTGLLFLGGSLLCCSFSCRNETDSDLRYSKAHSKRQRLCSRNSVRNKLKVS
uniref:Claudin n=1 Tax=Amphilophus citrinellus TaxID=61819 RepID=A0A3Q0SI66_AMPCI